MKAGRRRWWLLVVALAAVGLVGSACGSGATDDEAGDARRSSTTEAPGREEPTTSAPQPSTSTAPITIALPEPVLVDGVPQVKLTPSRGPAGTQVRLEGYGFTGDWQRDPKTLWLSDGHDVGECGVLAVTESDLELSDDGRLAGSFVVPETGVCRFSSGAVVNLGSGRFDVTFRCSTDCRIGSFTMILPGESTEEPTGTACDGYVAFGTGEDLAGDINADGLSCDEAKAFLQRHGGPLGPINGLAHIDAEGFSCDRTGVSDVHLPRATYKCTGGAERIWFVRI